MRNSDAGSAASGRSSGWGGIGGNSSRYRSNTTMAHDPNDRDDGDVGAGRYSSLRYAGSSAGGSATGGRGGPSGGGSAAPGNNSNNKSFAGATNINAIVSDDAYEDGGGAGGADGERFNPNQYSYQDLVHASAMTRLETELRDFLRSRPLSQWAEYDGNGGGYQASGKFPLPSPSGPDGGLHASALDPNKNYYAERSAKESAERIYSRSSVQRYILQRLAAELNGPQEVKRDFHSYEAFKIALASPEGAKLDLIKPNVVERPRDDDAVQQQQKGGGINGGGQNNDNNDRLSRHSASAASGATGSPTTKGPTVVSTYDRYNQQQNYGIDGGATADGSAPPVYKPGSYLQQLAREREQQQQQAQQQHAARLRQHQQRQHLLSLSSTTASGGHAPLSSPLSPHNDMSYSSPFGGAQQQQGLGMGAPLSPSPARRTLLNMYSYPNAQSDTVYVYRQ